MAIPFLNNIDLSDNQLLNAKLQLTSTAPTAAKGQIYFDSTTNVDTVKYYSDATDTWVSLIEHTYPAGTFITTTESGTGAKRTLTSDLSATGSPGATTFLRGDNTWNVPDGTYTWTLSGDTGSQVINSGDTASVLGGAYITTVAAATDKVTITHNATTRTDTTSVATPTLVGDFTTIDGVSTNSTGHITAVNVKTVTLPGNETITLTGDVTGSGTTSIATTIAAGAVDFAMINPAVVIVESEGIPNNDNDTTWPTSAAVKKYVDDQTAGGLIYQGGYNASTNAPHLDGRDTQIAVEKGWTYTVTAAGTFYGETVRVGDVLIAEVDLAAGAGNLSDWTTVQNNIDLADLSQVGIGNVNAGSGINVAYSSGTATVSLATPAATSYVTTITDTATITHSLATSDIMIQLYDITTGETVYAGVDRISTSQATISFAATPTNSVRVLVQKIV
jgi:hypothetical protein